MQGRDTSPGVGPTIPAAIEKVPTTPYWTGRVTLSEIQEFARTTQRCARDLGAWWTALPGEGQRDSYFTKCPDTAVWTTRIISGLNSEEETWFTAKEKQVIIGMLRKMRRILQENKKLDMLKPDRREQKELLRLSTRLLHWTAAAEARLAAEAAKEARTVPPGTKSQEAIGATKKDDEGAGQRSGKMIPAGSPEEAKELTLDDLEDPIPVVEIVSVIGRKDDDEREHTGSEASSVPATGEPRALRMSKEEANIVARRLLDADLDFAKKSQREWAAAIGCSEGLVNSLAVRKAVMEKRRENATPKAHKPPKAVSLTDKMAAVTGRNDDPSNTADTDAIMRKLMAAAKPEERQKLNDMTPDERRELAKVYAEQEADVEPSPLEVDPPSDRPKKVKTRKRV